jgi:hypothetical protein
MTQLLLYVAAKGIETNVFGSQAVSAVFPIHPPSSWRLPYANPICRPIAGATESARVHQGLQQEQPVTVAEFPVAEFPVTGKLPCALPQNFAGPPAALYKVRCIELARNDV